jgi:hypothetical protein
MRRTSRGPPAGNLIEVDWPDARTLDAPIGEDLIPLSSTVHQKPVTRCARRSISTAETAPQLGFGADPKEPKKCTQPTTP